LEAFVVGHQPSLFGQCLFPLPLEGATNQPVLRLGSIILPACSLGVVVGSLKPLAPLRVECRALAFQFASCQ
jgi:hypothetical protein